MPFKLEFYTDPSDRRSEGHQLEAAMAAIGFIPMNYVGDPKFESHYVSKPKTRAPVGEPYAGESEPVEGVAEPENDTKPEIDLDKFTVQGKPRTRPYQTRVRRTKAELEALNTPEGKAAADKVMQEELARIQGLPTDPTFIAEMEMGIQQGGDRIDPAVEAEVGEEVTAEETVVETRPTAEQVAAEIAEAVGLPKAKEVETPATVPAGKPVTHDTVRAAMGEYQKKFGFPAAREDVPKILTPYARTPEIPDEQPALLKAIKAFEDAIATNPYNRDVVK